MRLLVVEDEIIIAKRIEEICEAEGHTCQIAETGADALEMMKFYDFDLMMLDLMLPDIDGFEVLSRVRGIKNSIPVIVLSGLSSTEDKVKCLSMGADDYLTKPFSKLELLARISAVIRRADGHFSPIITVGPMELNTQTRTVRIYDDEVTLTSKEYAVMELLAMKKGMVLPKEAFLNHIYGGLDEPELKIVDVFVCKLRKKIADHMGGLNLIETVWGRGYTLHDFENDAPRINVQNIKKLNAG